ncbi:hypothetical protein IVA87_31695 [Bradyrhizobium sp. 147]|uniref:hypothetical protein n=1 Tax=unclassified Bradyrhizobium TaxID=2631580 RepID=UPI001FF97A0E|nr:MULTISPECIES: hypothetical protein [unclassified Bradyrhizobium]MCK1541136.1 hypothetical protein [Bradyrhizobium sp. 179]MCK1624647.1 hypothetical protein [Bradyrhizobium sp. 160]MCK1683827.1 hypothetical protein [Bradyrhizobium sp. 147]
MSANNEREQEDVNRDQAWPPGFFGTAAHGMMKVRKLLAFIVLGASLLLILVQFGPAVVFESEAASSTHMRAGAR